MIKTMHPRLRVPAVMAVLGSVIAVATFIGSGWAAAVIMEITTVILTVGYFALAGRDSDVGALVGSRPDERQATIGMRATALAGTVVTLVAIVGFVVATAVGRDVWPFLLICVVGGVTYLVGLAIYRRR